MTTATDLFEASAEAARKSLKYIEDREAGLHEGGGGGCSYPGPNDNPNCRVTEGPTRSTRGRPKKSEDEKSAWDHFGSAVLGFGKYRGMAVAMVAESDPQYLLWADREVASFNMTVFQSQFVRAQALQWDDLWRVKRIDQNCGAYTREVVVTMEQLYAGNKPLPMPHWDDGYWGRTRRGMGW